MSTHPTASDDDTSSTEPTTSEPSIPLADGGVATRDTDTDPDDELRDVPEEIAEAVAEAAARIDDAGEPVTVAKIAGTVLNDGVDPARFKTVLRGARRWLKDRESHDVEPEVVQ